MGTNLIFKSFVVEIESIFDFCAGFEPYFQKHPEEERTFPRCNDADDRRRKQIKSRDMFIGKKAERFSRLLQSMSIELDSAFLEAEYYLTPPGKGKIYTYKNGGCTIAFDFYVYPTSQIETCAIEVSFPKEREEDIVACIRELLSKSAYFSEGLYDGGFDVLYKQHIKKPDLDIFDEEKAPDNYQYYL